MRHEIADFERSTQRSTQLSTFILEMRRVQDFEILFMVRNVNEGHTVSVGPKDTLRAVLMVCMRHCKPFLKRTVYFQNLTTVWYFESCKNEACTDPLFSPRPVLSLRDDHVEGKLLMDAY